MFYNRAFRLLVRVNNITPCSFASILDQPQQNICLTKRAVVNIVQSEV